MAQENGARSRRLRQLGAAVLIGAALLAACWWRWWPPSPATVESCYVRACYVWLLAISVPVTEKTPFSITEWMLAAILLLFLARTISLMLQAGRRRLGWWRALARIATLGASIAAALYLGFLALWGLCYARAPIDRRLHWPAAQSEDQIADLARQLIRDAAADRASLGDVEVRECEPHLAKAVAEITSRLDHYLPRLPVRAKRVWPPGLLALNGTTGITSPWLHEAQIDPVLLPLEQPFTIAHEMAHVAGYASEAEASLIGYLACRQLDAPAVRYSGALALLPSALESLPDDLARQLVAEIPREVRADLSAIAARARRDRSRLLTLLSLKLYDSYLRNQGVSAGVRDYDRVIALLASYHQASG
jgi:hypothetical protein